MKKICILFVFIYLFQLMCSDQRWTSDLLSNDRLQQLDLRTRLVSPHKSPLENEGKTKTASNGVPNSNFSTRTETLHSLAHTRTQWSKPADALTWVHVDQKVFWLHLEEKSSWRHWELIPQGPSQQHACWQLTQTASTAPAAQFRERVVCLLSILCGNKSLSFRVSKYEIWQGFQHQGVNRYSFFFFFLNHIFYMRPG